MTLDFARSLRVEPGANRKGEQADTSWLFLLPSLELESVAVVGSASAATLVSLSALCPRVRVVAPSPRMRMRMRRLPAVEVGDARASLAPGPGTAPPELVYMSPGAAARLAAAEPVRQWLGGVLDAGGSLYVAPSREGRHANAASTLAERLGIRARVVVGLRPGETAARSAQAPAAWVIPAVPPAPGRWRRAALRGLRATRLLASRASRRSASGASSRVSEPERSLAVERVEDLEPGAAPGAGVLMRATTELSTGHLPRYLSDLGDACGVPLDPSTWRLAPPRGYRSQKVIFFARAAGGAELVLKLTQDGRFNELLENEAHALQALAPAGVADALSAPAVVFGAPHGRVKVLAEEAIAGRPFVHVSESGPRCEHARAVTRALTALGARTAVPAHGVEQALLEVVAHYERLYGPPAPVRDALAASARRLGRLEPRLPLVFMHGDATVYNVLVGEGARVGLVDWENGEPAGLPLWDLLHFLQAYAAWSAERAGVRYGPKRFRAQFLQGEGLEPLRGAALAAYCSELDLPEEAVQPLLHTWLARHAVRQARELPPRKLRSGYYHRLLAQAVEP